MAYFCVPISVEHCRSGYFLDLCGHLRVLTLQKFPSARVVVVVVMKSKTINVNWKKLTVGVGEKKVTTREEMGKQDA